MPRLGEDLLERAQKPNAPSPTAELGARASPRALQIAQITARQLSVDSRTPSSIARKRFCPRSLTPMITNGTAGCLPPEAGVNPVGPDIHPALLAQLALAPRLISLVHPAFSRIPPAPTIPAPAPRVTPSAPPACCQWISPSDTATAVPLPRFARSPHIPRHQARTEHVPSSERSVPGHLYRHRPDARQHLARRQIAVAHYRTPAFAVSPFLAMTRKSSNSALTAWLSSRCAPSRSNWSVGRRPHLFSETELPYRYAWRAYSKC